MTTFLELVRANGFETIDDYLDSISEVPVQNDISKARIEKIRRNEAMTEDFLGGAA